MRKRIVAGNWKMNLDLSGAEKLVKEITASLGTPSCNVILAPPFYFLEKAASSVKGKGILIAAQNCHHEKQGAFTGEVSAEMIKSIGCNSVIVGHSERRQYFAETDSLLLQKILRCNEAGLGVIFCVGENLSERESGIQEEVIRKQLENTVFKLSEKEISSLVLAYEPVWAIGTGKTAAPEQAQSMHFFIRGLVAKKYSQTFADSLSILYGGSCNAKNAAELFGQPDIDGGLIGGASLKADDFLAIIQACR